MIKVTIVASYLNTNSLANHVKKWKPKKLKIKALCLGRHKNKKDLDHELENTPSKCRRDTKIKQDNGTAHLELDTWALGSWDNPVHGTKTLIEPSGPRMMSYSSCSMRQTVRILYGESSMKSERDNNIQKIEIVYDSRSRIVPKIAKQDLLH